MAVIFSIMLPFIISNDPSKYREEIPKEENGMQNAIELQQNNNKEETLMPKKDTSEQLYQNPDLKNINMSLVNEVQSNESEIKKIQNSLRFFGYIVIMSYMLGMPMFFNISKKLVGINA